METIGAANWHSVGAQHQKIAKGASLRSRMHPYRQVVIMTKILPLLALGHDHRGRDRYGRTIGLCRADSADIGAAMVRAGMAWAFTRYSSDYVKDEWLAKATSLGGHAHGCQPAWDWRADRRTIKEP